MPTGRPTDYSPDVADIICERVACGESMRSIARDDAMPAMSTLFKWLREHSEFSEQYARAKGESADVWAEDIVDIPDNQTGTILLDDSGKPVLDEKGGVIRIIDAAAVAHAKLRVESRKWAASKLKPKKYGERQTIEHEIGDDLAERLQRGRNRVSNSGQNSTDSDQKG